VFVLQAKLQDSACMSSSDSHAMLNIVAAVQHVWWWAAEDGEEGDTPLIDLKNNTL
jgi:hypothetical protein